MRTAQPFAHLHVHSAFSLLDGLCRIPDLVAATRELGMGAVALTDHDVLYGAYDFFDMARDVGIHPILGCETRIQMEEPAAPFPVVLLAATFDGFERLQQLLSLARDRGDPPRIRLEDLVGSRDHLLCLSGSWPQSDIPRLCAEEREDDALALAGLLAEAVGPSNFYLEMQNHGRIAQQRANAGLRSISRRAGFPTVVTHNVHYLHTGEAEAHLLLQCIQAGIPWRQRGEVRAPTPGMVFRRAQDMAAAFPDDRPALQRTVEIAERCRCELPRQRPITFPPFSVPREFHPEAPRFELEVEYLRSLAREGLRHRSAGVATPAHRLARLDAELAAIERVGYARVLMALADLATDARRRGFPLGPGRSALTSSLTAYGLGITGVDPVEFGLVFERWLNSAQPGVPEIGLEIPPDGRNEMIGHLRERYGNDCVAHLLTFSTLGPRQALRDACRVFDIAPERMSTLLHRLPRGAESLSSASWNDLVGDESTALRLAHQIEGLPRNAGTHPTGLALSGCRMADRVPVSKDAEGILHIQLDHRFLNRAGLLKLDLSGPRILQAVATLFAPGREFDFDAIPSGDSDVYEQMGKGGLAGLCSDDLRDFLRRLRPRTLADVAMALALHRPGAPASPEDMLRRRAEGAGSRAPDPLLRNILVETEGVFFYEEQWISAVSALAGLSAETADRFFRLASADPAEARRQRWGLIAGFRRMHRIREPRAVALFEILQDAARRVVSKAGIMSSALMLYRAAWLALRRPRDFLVARILVEPGPGRRLTELLEEVRKTDMALLPPDVQRSGIGFHPEGLGLRFGLFAIRQVGEDAARAIVAERERSGPFLHLADFCRRLEPQGLSVRSLDALIRSGALDAFGEPRARMAAAQAALLEGAAALRKDRDAGQSLLFQPSEMMGETHSPSAQTDDWPEEQKRRDEMDLLGHVFQAGHLNSRS